MTKAPFVVVAALRGDLRIINDIRMNLLRYDIDINIAIVYRSY